MPPAKYPPTLATFTLVSQLPHYLAFSSSWVSIIGTLLLGTTALHVLESRMHPGERPVLLSLTLLLSRSSSTEQLSAAHHQPVVAPEYPQLFALLTTVFLLAAINWPHANRPSVTCRRRCGARQHAADRFGLPRSGRLPWLFYPGHLCCWRESPGSFKAERRYDNRRWPLLYSLPEQTSAVVVLSLNRSG